MFDGDMGLIDGILEFLVVRDSYLERGIVGKEKIWSVGPQKKGLRSDRYHDDQCVKGNVWNMRKNRETGKGLVPLKQKG
jgi:hypothetical protein